MSGTPITNAQLAELLSREAEREEGHRVRALRRASRAAMFWPGEASSIVAHGGDLTALPSVGPWVARLLSGWIEDPPVGFEPPEVRAGFISLAEARATIAAHAGWSDGLRADLQMHTTYSDGKATILEMLEASASLGHSHVLFTDHSKGLPIANGMDEGRLRAQGVELREANHAVAGARARIVGLHGIEMNLSPEGEGDMEPEALAELDVVLGAFHSKLRVREDQTERYLAALANPDVQVLAHPRGRMFGRRAGLFADWGRVFDAAARNFKALEIDSHPSRQDLDVERLRIARDAGAWISIGTDAHSTAELAFQEFGVALAIRAEIPRERILNFLSVEALRAWVAESRERSRRPSG